MEGNGSLEERVWFLADRDSSLRIQGKTGKGHTAYYPLLLGVVILGVKRPKREVDQLHLCSIELRMLGACAQ
jgi:hypothetical protein